MPGASHGQDSDLSTETQAGNSGACQRLERKTRESAEHYMRMTVDFPGVPGPRAVICECPLPAPVTVSAESPTKRARGREL